MLHDLTLEGHGVRLVPLADEHAEPLSAFVDDDLWAGMSSPTPHTPTGMRAEICRAVETPGRLALTVLDAVTGAVRGSTSFYDWDPRIGRVEIGYTFYDPHWWGTANNPACKLLMLTHAFETWGVARVAFRADARNTRSIAAIRRLGAVPEGVLRSHRLAPDGTRGDSAYFSILPDEWPAVRTALVARLAAAG